MEMSYEELTARLNAIDSKIDGLLSIIGQTVATKQFEMMLHSFEEADRTVKVILHQGPHLVRHGQNAVFTGFPGLGLGIRLLQKLGVG